MAERTEEFLQLLAEHERRLGIYVHGLIACPQDAQDILQEGKLVMWRAFEQFEPGTNFAAWGRKILFHQILSFRRKAKRQPFELLSEHILELLSTESDTAIRENRWDAREKALSGCLGKLNAENQQLIEMRYRDEASIEKIAHRLERTECAIYRQLSRVRQSLFECVEKTLRQT